MSFFRLGQFLSSLALVFSVSVACAEQVQPAEAVFLNGKIYTANAGEPWAEALVVSEDQLTYVGSTVGAMNFVNDKTSVYDLNGMVVLPGLIDAHVHPGWVAATAADLQLPNVDNQKELLAAIEEMIRKHAERQVIIAMAWDNTLFPTTGPHKRLLDEIESERPVLLWDPWMHSLWVNSKAFEVAGVDESVADPEPDFSYYQRDDQGKLTGYITESAATYFWGLIESLGAGPSSQVLEYFLKYLSDQGVTTLLDAGNFALDDTVYAMVQKLDQQGKLPLRYHGASTLYMPQDIDAAVDKLKAMRSKYSGERFKIDTLKIFFDGVIETQTAHLLDDYRNTPGNRGGSLMSRERLAGLLVEAEAAGFHVHIHTLGDQAVRTALDAVEDLHRQLGRVPAVRIALSHLQLVDPEDVKRFAELGVIANFTPAWHGVDGHYDNILGERRQQMFLTGSLLEQGAKITCSSDVYFTSQWEDGSASPFTGMQIGHTRQYIGGDSLLKPAQEALSREQAVDCYTRDAAYQLGLEDDLGTLEAGKKADFVIVERDLFDIDRYEINTLVPDAVFLDGKLVSGKMPPVRGR